MNDAIRYDALLEAGYECPSPCPVCTGEGEEPCGEDCDRIYRRCQRERQIRGLYESARRALHLAREYRIGDATSDSRIKAIVRRVYLIRQDIADLRAA
jgi:hypothetical protein